MKKYIRNTKSVCSSSKYGDTEDKWLYDVYLNDVLVGNQGDFAFDTKEEAEIDANDFIYNSLCKEYNVDADRFTVDYYRALY